MLNKVYCIVLKCVQLVFSAQSVVVILKYFPLLLLFLLSNVNHVGHDFMTMLKYDFKTKFIRTCTFITGGMTFDSVSMTFDSVSIFGAT